MLGSWGGSPRRSILARALVLGAILGASLALDGCARESAASPDASSPSRDAGHDAPTIASCATSAECDDGIACTFDACAVGNVCEHRAIDAMCAEDERCVVGRGCVGGTPTECTTNADCDDHRRCTGVEVCLLGACRVPEPYVCDDGNACTEDSCSDATDDCVFRPICDGGFSGTDAGPLCTPFVASEVYASSFVVPMAPSQGCAVIPTYTASPITFSITGGTLTARATGITMTQSPAPSGADFDVREDRGCAHFRLVGSFSCGNQGVGTFTASFDAGCAPCADQSRSVTLLR